MNDGTNMGDRGQNRGVGRDNGSGATQVGREDVIAPSDRILGVSGSIEGEDRPELDDKWFEEAQAFVDGVRVEKLDTIDAETLRVSAEIMGDADRWLAIGGKDPGMQIYGSTIADRLLRAAKMIEGGAVAALTIKLADAEERLAKYAAPVVGYVGGVDEMAKTLRGSAFSREQLNTAANLLESMRWQMNHDREHAGKLEARVRVLTGERDAATAARDMMQGKLADMTTNRDALDEACQRKDKRIAVVEGELAVASARVRDLIALEKKTRTTADYFVIERDTARDIAALFRETLVKVRSAKSTAEKHCEIDAVLATVPPERPRNAVESAAYLALGQWLTFPDVLCDTPHTVTEEQVLSWLSGLPSALAEAKRTNNSRPRCRVVTSPRFYGEADIERAADAIGDLDPSQWGWTEAIVDAVANALGMRRAAS